MTTNNPDFYPTPPKVIIKMLEPYSSQDLLKLKILDPSAGAGDILDYIKGISESNWQRKKPKVYAIESDPELAFVLQGKDYPVIAGDFLSYQGDHHFDLIVMNPPFRNGDDHLLKAWEIIGKGDIVCLLNRETIDNPYTRDRELLAKIIQDHGSVEYLGNVFADAARRTDVDIALVRLHKNKPDPRFTFDTMSWGEETMHDFNEEIMGNQIALNDVIGAKLRQYELTKAAFVNYMKAKRELDFYSQGLLSQDQSMSSLLKESYDTADLGGSYNSFVDALKMSAWTRIIASMGMDKYLTAGVVDDFRRFKKSQGAIDLTRENIYGLAKMLLENRSDIMERAVGDVFDLFTKYHKENRAHFEGWKTNDSWKVNRKVILPRWVSYGVFCSASDLKSYGSTFTLNEERSFEDIDKVMCHLTGKDYNKIFDLRTTLWNHFRAIGTVKTGDQFDAEGTSEFFEFKFFKKGTLHITFRDAKLWEEFNRRACLGKEWLPPETDKKRRYAA